MDTDTDINDNASTSNENNLNQSNVIKTNIFKTIKNKNEEIIKQKWKYTSKLSNLERVLAEFGNLIDETNTRKSDLETEKIEINKTAQQERKTRNKVVDDVTKFQMCVQAFSDKFNEMKISTKEIISKEQQMNLTINQVKDKIMKYKNHKFLETNKLLQSISYKENELRASKENRLKFVQMGEQYLENVEEHILSLDKIITAIPDEIKNAEMLNLKLETERKTKKTQKIDLENDLKIMQDKYQKAIEDFESEKTNFENQIVNLKSDSVLEIERINELNKKIEELTKTREIQNKYADEIKKEVHDLKTTLSEREEFLENSKNEFATANEKIEKFRLESTQTICSYEKTRENLENEYAKIKECNDELKLGLPNLKEKVNNLKEEYKLKSEEICAAQNKTQTLKLSCQENGTKYNQVINDYNQDLNNLKEQNNDLLKKKEQSFSEIETMKQMLITLNSKKDSFLNKSNENEGNKNSYKHELTKQMSEINDKYFAVQQQSEEVKLASESKIEENVLKTQDKINKILEDTKKYREKMENIAKDNEEKYNKEKKQILDENLKMEFQIEELTTAIDKLKINLNSISTEILNYNNNLYFVTSQQTVKSQTSHNKKKEFLQEKSITPVPTPIIAEKKSLKLWRTDSHNKKKEVLQENTMTQVSAPIIAEKKSLNLWPTDSRNKKKEFLQQKTMTQVSVPIIAENKSLNLWPTDSRNKKKEFSQEKTMTQVPAPIIAGQKLNLWSTDESDGDLFGKNSRVLNLK